MPDREKREEEGNTKMCISRQQKELFKWDKKYFSYEGNHLVKKWK